MNYELKLEQFSGPIEKLLELIEEKKMEITELSLAAVTGDFLNYLRKLETIDPVRNEISNGVEPRLLADFVAIASHLLLIKSKALLPSLELTTEEEKDIKDLESRLRFYQEFKPAMNYLKKLWEGNNFSVSRPLFSGRQAFFYPSENITINELHKAIGVIFEAVEKLSLQSGNIKFSLVTLEEKIEEVMKRLKTDLKFTDLAKAKCRSEVIVLFLAVLHLLAKQLIKVEQKKGFSDIMIGKK